MVEENKKRYL